MEKTKKMTPGRTVALVILLLPPAAILLIGIAGAFGGMVLNLTWILSMFLLPLLTGLCVVLIVRADKHVLDKVFFSVLLFGTAFLLFGGIQFFGVSEMLFPYESREEAVLDGVTDEALMPEDSQLGDPIDVECYQYVQHCAIFLKESEYLICKYDPEEYSRQKESLQQTYVFQATEIVAWNEQRYKPTATINGYTFRALSVEGEYEILTRFPKYQFIIGTNDKTCEIVYLSFEDFDLDSIESLEDFISKDCGWQHIR